jgi:hypothetical protein
MANTQTRRSCRSSLCRGPLGRLLCVGIALGLLAYAASPAAGAEEPHLPGVNEGSSVNLSVGIYWGLYEQAESQSPVSIGIVGAPMPFEMQLRDNGEHRLFAFVQHRLPSGPYCAESPAQMEDVSVALTSAAGDAITPGPPYSSTYLWTPTEPGNFILCAYLDSSASAHPAEINFIQLTADPAPGQLSLSVAAEAGESRHITVKAQGEAVVPSEMSVSVQEQGLPCTLPDGRLAGQQLFESSGGQATGPSSPGAVGSGPFTASYSFTAEKPGAYEACAYLTPASTEKMSFWRPYEVGSTDFVVQEESLAPPSVEPQAVTARVSAVPPPPTLSGASIIGSRFSVAGHETRLHGHPPLVTAVRFTVSEPSTITVTITRVLPGLVRHGHGCVPPRSTAETVHARRCDRAVTVASSVHSVAAAGYGSIRLGGLPGHDGLPPGSYLATLTAHNANGESGPVMLRFRVAR